MRSSLRPRPDAAGADLQLLRFRAPLVHVMRHAVPVDQHKNGGAPVHRVPGRAPAVRRAAIQQLMPGPPMLAVMADYGPSRLRRGPHVARARFKITIRRLDAM